MKDKDRVNIMDGLVFENLFDKVEKSGFEKPSFRGGDIIISPPGTDRVKELRDARRYEKLVVPSPLLDLPKN